LEEILLADVSSESPGSDAEGEHAVARSDADSSTGSDAGDTSHVHLEENAEFLDDLFFQ
jgi:hypothetical protein